MLKKDLFLIQFIDIVSVENSLPICHYSADKIEALATNYLECGGNIKPIIVQRIGLDEYRVIEGNLELYAAKKAKEKDKFFEMIRAIILDTKSEKLIQEQVNLLRSTDALLPAEPSLLPLESSLLAQTDGSSQTSNSLLALKIVERLEVLENSLLAKFEQLTIKLDALSKDSRVGSLDIEKEQSIDKMSVAELKTEAKKRGLSGYSKLKKAELISLLSQDQ